MTYWHGYILLEKTEHLNQENFDALRDSFRAVDPVNPILPAHFMHTRVSVDSSGEIFECKFDPADIEVENFKQFMADVFEVEVEDIDDYIIEDVSYSGEVGVESRRWGFAYPLAGSERLQVTRYGRGGVWAESREECLAYVLDNPLLWEPEDE